MREDGKARLLLATALLGQGDYAGAELQLRRALESGLDPEIIYQPLARALATSGDHKRTISELGGVNLRSAEGNALVKTVLGEAYFGIGQLDKAKSSFAAALSASPDNARARLGEARILAFGGDFAAATKIVDAVQTSNKDAALVLSLKADLLQAQAKPDDAIATLEELISITPNEAHPRFSLVSLLISEQRLDRATVEIAQMKQIFPRDIRWQYLEALLAFRKGDSRAARDAAVQVLNVFPAHGPALLLAGAAEYQLGSLATAEDHLKRVLATFPDSRYARNLLAATYLRRGQPRKAEDIISPILKQSPTDPALLRTAGEIAFANNNIAEAANLYERAIALESDNQALKTRLAQIRLAGGDSGRALDDLQIISRLDSNQFQADLSLISAFLGRKEYDKALAAVAVLERKQPGNPLTHTARGTIFAAKKDLKGARLHLEKALALQFNYLPAARILAGMDIADKQLAAARQRFESILAREPTNDGAYLYLAETLVSAGATEREITGALNSAIKANPGSTAARVMLVRHLAKSGNAKAALSAAQAASTAFPADPLILDVLGLAQLAAGETTQAIESFGKLVAMQPDSPHPLMRLASAQYSAKQVDEPIRALRKALSLEPGLLEAQRLLIAAQIDSGRIEDAMTEIKSVQASRPRDSVGFAMEGDVLAGQDKHIEAAIAYAEGLKRQRDPELVVKQLQHLHAAGKSEQANEVARKWLKEQPKDPIVRFHIANSALQVRNYRLAAEKYREVLNLKPDAAAVLNNLAWALNELSDPAAITYAEKAYKASPENPEIQDTLGWLLTLHGDAKRGIALLRLAANAVPQAAEIRLHLAKALIKSGDKLAAKKELETIVANGDNSPQHAEAAKLLRQF